ncbi:hypothetical protein [Rhizobium sp. MHM7A]|uniref:hypothetical protein n=1 Tax=Rhizobium sp. MHM7A TaxID=2583233 RepID=UPI00110586A2|nr:hypothetical protein [Rhizobium sp. MHM7A]TLX16669.1 hypothetical protein FFR93_04825 [Rhizobium sp. MHM7A]
MKIEIDITDQMPEMVEFIRHQTEIDIDQQQIADLLAKEVRLVADIAEWGWCDTEVKSRVIGVVTHRFLNRGWPTYGEKMNVRTFINQLKKAAEAQGFKTLAQSEDLDEDAGSGHPAPTGWEHRKHPFAPRDHVMSAAQRWAFTTENADVALRTKAYAAFGGNMARLALVTMFPDGSALPELNRRVAERRSHDPDVNIYKLRNEVIEDIAQEVLALGKKLSEAKLSSSAQSLLKERFNQDPPRAPFLALLTHSDGTQEMLLSGIDGR